MNRYPTCMQVYLFIATVVIFTYLTKMPVHNHSQDNYQKQKSLPS